MREWVTTNWLRLKALLRRRQLERDLEDELAFHFAERSDTSEARTDFGNPTLWKERTRELWTFATLETLAQDLRYAGRLLRKSPVFTAIAISSLALGIGGTTAIFSLMDALLLRSLPVREPDRLAAFGSNTYTYQAYEFFRDNNRVFTGIFATGSGGSKGVSIEDAGQERSEVEFVTGSYFPVLGVPAALGRTLDPEDDRTPGGHPVAVISFAYWERRFHRDPQIAGKVIRISRFPFTVIGVAAPGFSGIRVDSPTEIWIPVMMQREVTPELDRLTDRPGNYNSWLHIFGRLKAGHRLQDAQPPTSALWGLWLWQLGESYGSRKPDFLRRMEQSAFQLLPGSRGISYLRRDYTFPLQILMAATALVLLIACANLANLLMARAGARKREIGVRLSLGAARGRLIRQMLTESALLSICGAALGVFIAQWGGQVLRHMISRGPEALSLDTRLDWRVIGFTILASVTTTLLFGLWPALRSTRIEVSSSLKQGGAVAGRDRSHSGRFLTLVQVALSIVLLVSAGIFLRSLGNLRQLDLGIRAERLIQLDFDPRGAGYKGETYRLLCRRLLERLTAVPGVQAATLSQNGLFSGWASSVGSLNIPGFVPQRPEDRQSDIDVVGPRYFTTLGIPVVAGRDFSPQDSENAPKVIVVNEAFARFYFPGGNPIGRKFQVNGPVCEIVGVALDARGHAVREAPKRRLYVPYFQVEETSKRCASSFELPPIRSLS